MKFLPPPGPERTRAVGLLLVLLLVLAWMVWPRTPPGTGPAAPVTPIASAPRDPNLPATAVSPAPVSSNGVPAELRLAALDLATLAPREGRNPFRYGVRPPPPPPPIPSNPMPLGPPAPPLPTGPPPVPLSLTGLATLPGEHRVATLTDRTSGAVFQAVEGQVVDGRYRVVRIGLQSAVVAYVDGSGQRTIPLGGR